MSGDLPIIVSTTESAGGADGVVAGTGGKTGTASLWRHVMCKDKDASYQPVAATTTFAPTDQKAMSLLTGHVNTKAHTVWYYRHESAKAWNYYTTIDWYPSSEGDYYVWFYILIADYTPSTFYPWGWKVDIFLDNNYQATDFFEITNGGLTKSTMSEGVDGNGNPVGEKGVFVIGVDSGAYHYVRFDLMAYYNEASDTCHSIRCEWYNPSGSLYKTHEAAWPDYKNTDPNYDYWGWGYDNLDYLSIDSSTPTGVWTIKVYFDQYYDSGWLWYGPFATTQFTVTKTLPRSHWTVMAYLDGDNNLESHALAKFMSMSQVTTSSDVRLVAELDRTPGYDTNYGDWTDTKRYVITNGMTPTIANAVQDLGEQNMGDPNTLTAFIGWAVQNYPADHYFLILFDHGSGAVQMQMATNVAELGILWDYTDDYDCLTTPELGQALGNTGTYFEVVYLDACSMGMVEVGYQIASYGNVLVASEEIGWANYPDYTYSSFLGSLVSNPSMTSATLATNVVTVYANEWSYDSYKVAIAAVDLTKLRSTGLVTAIDGLALELEQKYSSYSSQIQSARSGTETFEGPIGGYTDYYIDLYHFSDRVYNSVSDTDVRNAASNVKSYLSAAVIAFRQYNHPNSHGLSIFFPDSQSKYNTYKTIYKATAFAISTNWDEWLDAYYVPPAPPAFDFSLSNSGGIVVGLGSSGSNIVTATLMARDYTISFFCKWETGDNVLRDYYIAVDGGVVAHDYLATSGTISAIVSLDSSSDHLVEAWPIINRDGSTYSGKLYVDSQLVAETSDVHQGKHLTYTMTGGSSQSVSLSCTGGLPSGASCSFNPQSANPTFSSTLTISISSPTPLGTYTITVTGIGGGKTHTTQFGLTVVDRIKVTSGGVSDSRLDVGTTSKIWFKLAYESDGVAFDSSKGTVYIGGKVAQWSSANNRWELSESSSVVQKKPFSVTSVTDTSRGSTNINDMAGPQEVTWDRIKITGMGSDDDRRNIVTTGTFWATAVLEYDNHALGSGDSLTISGKSMTWSAGNSRFEATDSKSTVQAVTYNTFTSGNEVTYGITAGTMNGYSTTIIWDRLIVNYKAVDDDRRDISTSGEVRFKLRSEYDSAFVQSGSVSINGSAASWDAGNSWWKLSVSQSSVCKKNYVVTAVSWSTYGITALNSGVSTNSTSIIWDRLIVNYKARDDDRRDINTQGQVRFRLRSEYDNVFVQSGSVSINGTSATWDAGNSWWKITNSQSSVYSKNFIVTAVSWDVYGIIALNPGIATNGTSIVWDRIRIFEGGVSASLADVGTTQLVWAKAKYEYDGLLLNSTSGVLYVNGSTMVWSNSRARWEYNYSSAQPKVLIFVFTSIQDKLYGLTILYDVTGPKQITWTGLRVDSMIWDKDLANASDAIEVHAHLIYAHNMSTVAGGSIGLNGTSALTNNTGWATFSIVSDTPSISLYVAKGLKDSLSIITAPENNQSHRFAWTAIEVNHLSSNATAVPLGSTVRITVKAIWAHNGSAIANALVELNGNLTVLQASTNSSGYAWFDVTAQNEGDYLYNLTGKEAYGFTKALGSKSIRIKFGFECQMSLVLRSGYNLISLPVLNDSLTASSLLNQIGNYSQSVFMFNTSSGRFVSYDKTLVEFGIPQPDFSIEPNVGYFVYLSNDTTAMVGGIRNSFSRIIPLRMGYNLVGWTCVDYSSVKLAFMNFSFIDSAFAFNVTSQRYISYDRSVAEFGIPQPDFDIIPGEGYFIFANEDDCLYYGGG